MLSQMFGVNQTSFNNIQHYPTGQLLNDFEYGNVESVWAEFSHLRRMDNEELKISFLIKR